MKMTEQKAKHRIAGKLVLHGRLVTTSPLLIGKGKGDEADTEVMVMPGSNKPYVPGSSLAGALRGRFYIEFGKPQAADTEAFWGSDDMPDKNNQSEKNTCQSHLIVDDLQLTEQSTAITVIRDGVSINPKTGTSVTHGKYDYQLVEPGAAFGLRMEVTIREFMDRNQQRSLLKYIKEVLTEDDFRIGALTNFGFGKFDLHDIKSWEFYFKDEKESAEKWFEYLKEEKSFNWKAGEINWNAISAHPDKKPQKKFQITAHFLLKSSFITGSYGIKSDAPDKAQLTSNGRYILSGKSVKGAIRQRALKILNTVQAGLEKKNHQLIDYLLGWVEHANDPYRLLEKEQAYGKKAIRSRLRIEETDMNDTVLSMTQDRIKIDRFTGGVMPGAKFDSQPVWQKGMDGFTITFTLFEYADWEAALLLHLLKDLWTEDLPIGGEKNVGRGILIGQSATIRWDGQLAEIKRNKKGINGNIGALAQFNKPLFELLNPKKAEA